MRLVLHPSRELDKWRVQLVVIRSNPMVSRMPLYRSPSPKFSKAKYGESGGKHRFLIGKSSPPHRIPGAEFSALAGCGEFHQIKQAIRMIKKVRDEWNQQAIVKDEKFHVSEG